MSEFDSLVERFSGKVLPDFPVIKDGVMVHSRLRAEDLRLMRRAFIAYCESGKASFFDEGRLMLLMKRMLRKVK